jgi:hypothetical protein
LGVDYWSRRFQPEFPIMTRAFAHNRPIAAMAYAAAIAIGLREWPQAYRAILPILASGDAATM